MTKVRITATGDGLRKDIRVFIDDKEVSNVTAARIHPIGHDRVVRVSLDLVNVELDISGELVDDTALTDDVTHHSVGKKIVSHG